MVTHCDKCKKELEKPRIMPVKAVCIICKKEHKKSYDAGRKLKVMLE